MTEFDVIAASEGPVTERSLVADLRSLGLRAGMTVLIHSSLSSLGWVCGGSTAVIRALFAVVGASGTLVMPAHSAGSDPGGWENPPVPRAWWDTIRSTMPPLDPAITPKCAIGVIPEQFRAWPGVVRSHHPTGLFAARGPLAVRITAEQPLEDPFGERSPRAAMYELRAVVLLLGVGHGSDTTLHLAERRALGADQERVRGGAALQVDGVRRWVSIRKPDLDASDFEQVGSAFERQDDSTMRGLVGNGRGVLLDAQSLVDFAGPWFRKHRRAT